MTHDPSHRNGPADKNGQSQSSEAENVSKMIRRLALLYKHFAETLHTELGPARARELTRKAIDAYGAQIGREAKERNVAAGIPLSAANYADDLPSVGWEMNAEMLNGEDMVKVTKCPIADELKGMDKELARIYCYVDQAKMDAYNPCLAYIHLKNMLDGDEFCRHVVRPRKRPRE
ncbi:L-2-amino-thiazoline-4-carboxylic acid hydrolase [Desulfovibrio sp. OttesenSCG-928-I05]|nr:L-2-amino-thiazoline-4-carboxylic acid hydrolase [Desulfovibrio sp. OttesenSCG-928-I05]